MAQEGNQAHLNPPNLVDFPIVQAFLDVRASNDSAIKLYKKMGFCEVGRRQRYYLETREDAVVMVKEMTGAAEQNIEVLRPPNKLA